MTIRFSASSMDLFDMCPEAWSRRYVEGDRRISNSIPTTIGKAVHVSARVDLELKRDEGSTMPDDAVPDISGDAFDLTWSNEVPTLSEDEAGVGVDTAKANAKEVARSLAELHHVTVASEAQPLIIEEKVEVELDGFPYPLIGYIDLGEQSHALRDLKTKAKTPGRNEAANSTQAALYSMMYETATGWRPPHFTIDALVKTKVPKLVQQTVVPTGDYTPLLMRMERMAQVIEAGAFMPAAPGHWKCSERWCEYYEDCPWGRARRKMIGGL